MDTEPDGTTARDRPMIADIDFKFSQHDETVRRAERNARLMEALATEPATSPAEPNRRKVAALLRRIAGTPAAA
jgi:hypothetical protein